MTPLLYGLVLAGGNSRRMGSDKAAIDYHGEPEVRRVYSLLSALCARAYVSVRNHQLNDSLFADVPRVADDLPGEGPAIGVLSALQSHADAAWLVVGCDMPLLDHAALDRLISARAPECAVTAYIASDGEAEPLCAIYEPVCRTALSDAVARGHFGLRRLLREWDVKLVRLENQVTTSANTPEERAKMRAAIQRKPILKM